MVSKRKKKCLQINEKIKNTREKNVELTIMMLFVILKSVAGSGFEQFGLI